MINIQMRISQYITICKKTSMFISVTPKSIDGMKLQLD